MKDRGGGGGEEGDEMLLGVGNPLPYPDPPQPSPSASTFPLEIRYEGLEPTAYRKGFGSNNYYY